MIIVRVVFSLPIRGYFEYFMCNSMYPVIGGRIVVPFRSKDIIGIIISFYTKNNFSQLDFKYVKSIIDTESIYTDIVLDLLIWISENCHCPIGQLFFLNLPKFLRDGKNIQNKPIYQWTITEKGKNINFNQLKKRTKKFDTLLILKKNSILSTELKKYQVSKIILKKLEIEKLCEAHIFSKINIKKYNFNIKKDFFLNKSIITAINNILKKKSFSSWLLTKVGFFNKVKFYLGLIKSVLSQDMQILILVPYIKYINIIIIFLKRYFNVSTDIIHEKLTYTKYLKNWIRIKNGENSIIIGTKKSIFLPFFRLGLIILLEEHELNYKNIKNCRYNVRDIGILRAYKENIPIVLDSDTPSLKTLHNVLLKKCSCIKINQCNYINRLNNNIIDLNKEKIKFGISMRLIKEIHKHFKGKQILLIFNKISLFFFVLICNKCGFIFTCTSCNNYFEINRYYNVLFCKFCLIKIKKPFFCYNCKNFFLSIKILGIEDLKNRIQIIFPGIPLFFLLNKKDINKNIIDKKCFNFYISKPCIIFATEEIAQNYFFPHVKLIVLISIDHYFSDFHFQNIEYFGQFYMNLGKLTRNRNAFFKIIIQTSFLKNLNLRALFNTGYFNFAHEILMNRKIFCLPPWSYQSIIYSESINFEYNLTFLNLLHKILKRTSKKYNCSLWCMGPNPSFIFKNKKKFFYQLLVQCSSRVYLYRLIKESINIINFFSISKTVKWFIDVEPN